ncbi:uncharacterized protein LOC107615564 [Arachis ipaensis]|uniref:uncharacterized protein LOC107615564 n=1 Tax=Arachis ipaensis TaxID=130454 RepID=UPI0007AF117A|nr:uncharacterized protein LOC107615564 [Arachis ipaensis]
MIESSRKNYIHSDQEKLRCEMYKGVKETVLNGETTPSSCGKRIILPSSFTGGHGYMIQNYQDAMAICMAVGYPDLFITFTCNPKWPDVEDFLNNRELNPQDRPDIWYTIEFQKHGLPHAYILLFLHKDDKFPTAEDIDKIISAEIPDKETDPEYFDAVEKHMMHDPCGVAKKDSPCMENAKCIRHFPKRFVESTTIDDDDYPSRSIKYLFKYVNKGHDRVTASFYKSAADKENMDDYDEVTNKIYSEARSLTYAEFPIHFVWKAKESVWLPQKSHAVIGRIFFVPPGSGERYYLRLLLNYVRGSTCYEDIRTIDGVVYSSFKDACYARGLLDDDKEYVEAIVEASYWGSDLNMYGKKHALYYVMTYFIDTGDYSIIKAKESVWLPQKSHAVIGRIFFVPPGSGERYYLRLLLNYIRGPTCYEDIRTIDSVVYSSFKDACYARGLLDDDKEYVEAIVEASYLGSALVLIEDEIKDLTLMEIENILNKYNKSLKDFPPMPMPDTNQCNNLLYPNGMNRLICDELRYDRQKLAAEHVTYLGLLTDEQKEVYNEVITTVQTGKGGVFFLYGYGRTGKTFVWKTLASALRSRSHIVLTVASSGIASLLLPGGRTAHSHFAIPLNID